jgi:toxoflavin biosynthesis protein ToxD
MNAWSQTQPPFSRILPRKPWRYSLGSSLGGLLLLTGCLGKNPANPDANRVSQSQCEASGDFIYIPAGAYQAGSSQQERDYAYDISAQYLAHNRPAEVANQTAQLRQKGWFDQEQDPQTIKLSAICMSRHLVTNADYQTFVRSANYSPPFVTPANYQEQGFTAHKYNAVEPYLWKGYQFPDGQADHPVVLVSYEDALNYTKWLSQRDGVTYRLPTAQEWEKAARGTDGRYFPWGNQWRDDATNWQGSPHQGTTAIGTYPLSRSVYGIEDMAGNVFEYTSTLVTQGGKQYSLLKGCAWDDLPGFCRAAYAHTRRINAKHILFGFRLVREVE